jgi:hypothetical protein
MKVDLKEVHTLLLNLDEDTERREASMEVLRGCKLNPVRFQGVKHAVGVRGCGASHERMLGSESLPLLIFEDDIESTLEYCDTLEVPDAADAVYLGISNHGYVRGHNFGIRNVVLASQYSEDFKRVFNMCSTHAILYLTEEYKRAALKVIRKCLANNTPFDLGLATIHKDFTVLTPNKPFFYQKEQPSFTNLELEV